FSSRRRHTRCYRDWSSDVCSSDLIPAVLRRLRIAAPSVSALAAAPSAIAPGGVGATPRRATLLLPPAGTTSTAFRVWLPRSSPMDDRLPNKPIFSGLLQGGTIFYSPFWCCALQPGPISG